MSICQKGIVLAGGAGTRLRPMTHVVNKHLLPVYDKPMIQYPISTLMLAGIRDVLIISNPNDVELFQTLLGCGSEIGMSFSYATQTHPRGLAEAFTIGAEFIGSDGVALALGDNLFYGAELPELLHKSAQAGEGATVFGCCVSDPENYGVVTFDDEGNPKGLEEKPTNADSNCAITGLYFYDNNVVSIAQDLQPSERGELEITAVNSAYLEEGRLRLEILPENHGWVDVGTPERLFQASQFVRDQENAHQTKIGCLESVAFQMGFISTTELIALAKDRNPNKRSYLLKLADKSSNS